MFKTAAGIGFASIIMMLAYKYLSTPAARLDQNPDDFAYCHIPDEIPGFMLSYYKDGIDALSQEKREDFFNQINIFIKTINVDLLKLFPMEVLGTILAQTPPARFFVGLSDVVRSPAYRIDSDKSDAIELSYDFISSHKEFQKNALRNEFFHAYCVAVNQQRNAGEEKMFFPYLNPRGEIDLELRGQYFRSLRNAHGRIARLQELTKKKSENLTPEELSELKYVEKLLEHYEPKVFAARIYSRHYSELISKDHHDEIIIKQNTLFNNKRLPYDIKVVETRLAGNGGRTAKHKPKYLDIYYSNTGSNIERFLRDSEMILQTFNGYLENPRSYSGFFKNREEAIIQIGSDLCMLGQAALQFFAPEFCAYMTAYGNLKQSYCAIPVRG